MIVGGYSLHLYCRHALPTFYDSDRLPTPAGFHPFKAFPHQIEGKSERECLAIARRRGWRFSDGDAECPHCVRHKRKETKQPPASDAAVRPSLTTLLAPEEGRIL